MKSPTKVLSGWYRSHHQRHRMQDYVADKRERSASGSQQLTLYLHIRPCLKDIAMSKLFQPRLIAAARSSLGTTGPSSRSTPSAATLRATT